MKQRTIPYGYTIQNGVTVPHPDESTIVRRVFDNYLGGVSLLAIARALTAEGIEFLPGRSDWNKNRVKRILEELRYTGTNTYPPIITEGMHRAGNALKNERAAVKDSKNINMTSEVPFHPPPIGRHSPVVGRRHCPVECFCGSKMTRRHDSRRVVSQDMWICQNRDCGWVVNINNDVLLAEVTALLNRLIEDPSLIQTNPPGDTPMEIRWLQNEMNRRLDGSDFDKDEAKAATLSLAAEKYRLLDNDNTISHMLRAEFARQRDDDTNQPLSYFSGELFKRTVKKIRFHENGQPGFILMNDQYIRKELDHADSDNTGYDAAVGGSAG